MPTTERLRHPLALRTLEVTRTEALTEHMRRITFTGDALASLVSASPDDHVKLLFPDVPGGPPPAPEIGPNGLLFPGAAPRPAMRDYTPRRLDGDELVIDFVVHGDGPASTWAGAAAPGDRITQAGPRGSLVVAGADWYLLAGDETALPSIGRRLEELPAGVRALVVVEVEGPGAELPLPSAADVSVTWLHRDGIAAGHGTQLLDAIVGLVLPEGSGFAWVACEAGQARELRRHLRVDRALPKAWTKATGYWRLGTANHHDPPED